MARPSSGVIWTAVAVAVLVGTLSFVVFLVTNARLILPSEISDTVDSVRMPLIDEQSYRPIRHRLSPNTIGGDQKSPIAYVNATQPLFMCLAPKTGCTAWWAFVFYVNDHRNLFGKLARNPGAVHKVNKAPWLMYNHRWRDELMVRDRVAIVRNPYVRFLSSYLDWKSRNRQGNVSFEEFAHMYKQHRAGKHGVFEGWIFLANHVEPVAEVCQVSKLRIGTFLRIEQMDLWYDTFMHHYGLDRFEARLRADGHEFYRPFLNSTTMLSEKLREAIGMTPWAGNARHTAHVRNSAAHLAEYYTPAMARFVFDLQRFDFEAFGYPAWDGDPNSFLHTR